MNIGWFSALGNAKSEFLFRRVLEQLKQDSSLKDQRVLINLCRHPQGQEDMWEGTFGLLPPHVIACNTRPFIFEQTIGIRK